MAFMQKKKLDEFAETKAAGEPGQEGETVKPVMHVHRDKEGNLVHMHFLGGDEAAKATANPHLDALLKRLEERREDDGA